MIGHKDTKRPIVLYIHIPKAGGTTFNSVLRLKYGRNKLHTVPVSARDDLRTLEEMPQKERDRLSCVRGHMVYGADQLFSVPCTYVTFLRDPVSRVLSLYEYVRRGWPDTVGRMSLEEYLVSNDISYVPNDQVRRIAGIRDYRSIDNAVLKSAINNLKSSFSAVGIVERFDESLLLIAKSLGWKVPPFYMRENVTGGGSRGGMTQASLIDMIEAQNQWDRKLYDRVAADFEGQVARMFSSNEILRFKKLNRFASHYFRRPVVTYRRVRKGLIGD